MKKLLGITILSVSASFVSPTYAADNAVMKACNQRERGAIYGAEGGSGVGFRIGLGVCPASTFFGGPVGYATCMGVFVVGGALTGSVMGEEVGGQIDGCGGPISNRLITPDHQ